MNKYPSRYSNGKMVSAAQYITELICENRAKFIKEDIGFKFWTNKKWSKFYRDQIATANKLLTKFSDKAIIRALNNKKAEKIYSLRAPHLMPIIEDEQSSLEIENTKINKTYDRSEDKTFVKQSNNRSKLSRLKDLE